jgi:hypothetical protein
MEVLDTRLENVNIKCDLISLSMHGSEPMNWFKEIIVPIQDFIIFGSQNQEKPILDTGSFQIDGKHFSKTEQVLKESDNIAPASDSEKPKSSVKPETEIDDSCSDNSIE